MARETIYETFMLPSGGNIYEVKKGTKTVKGINPVVDLTCIKVWQEMKRTSPSELPYRQMSEAIEDCMKDKLEIPVYDLCLGDYQYLLYKLRVVTYGSIYKMPILCPTCGKYSEVEVNLDDLDVIEFNKDFYNYTQLKLPNGDDIEIRYQTPRILDSIGVKARLMAKNLNTSVDYSLLFTLVTAIVSVNGVKKNEVQLEEYCKNLSMQDCNYIIAGIDRLNSQIGMGKFISAYCSVCKNDVVVPFRTTSEFLEPITRL